MLKYEAKLIVPDDGLLENNRMLSVTMLEQSPRVLVVQTERNPSVIPSLLDRNAMEVDVTDAEMLPETLSGYLGYSAIIFDNVPGHLVGEHKMTVIEQAVKSFGTGFMMVGGDESYGLGGYFKSPIERLLPVEMEVKGKEQLPVSRPRYFNGPIRQYVRFENRHCKGVPRGRWNYCEVMIHSALQRLTMQFGKSSPSVLYVISKMQWIRSCRFRQVEEPIFSLLSQKGMKIWRIIEASKETYHPLDGRPITNAAGLRRNHRGREKGECHFIDRGNWNRCGQCTIGGVGRTRRRTFL